MYKWCFGIFIYFLYNLKELREWSVLLPKALTNPAYDQAYYPKLLRFLIWFKETVDFFLNISGGYILRAYRISTLHEHKPKTCNMVVKTSQHMGQKDGSAAHHQAQCSDFNL